MKKRLWIPIILLLIILCVPVMAEEEAVWTFDIDNDSLDGYSGAGGDVVVPDTIQGCPVTVIGSNAFSSSDTITSLTFPESVRQLEGSVGGWCSSLTGISLPRSLQVIGDGCFSSNEALEQVTIPSQVCYIGSTAFYFCPNLKSVTFEGECPRIGQWAFTEISADAVIYVPDDQVEAYKSALESAGCTAAIQPGGQNSAARERISDLENLEFNAAAGTITGYTGEAVDVVVPRTIGGKPVRVIGYHAFDAAKDYTDTEMSTNRTEWVHIRSIVIPDTVRTIEDNALSYLQQLELFVSYAPLETTGGTQFMLCRSLKYVIFVNPL